VKLKKTATEAFNLLHEVHGEETREISQNDFGGCFKAVKQHVGSNGDNYKKDNK
jgi:hypothetical protein